MAKKEAYISINSWLLLCEYQILWNLQQIKILGWDFPVWVTSLHAKKVQTSFNISQSQTKLGK